MVAFVLHQFPIGHMPLVSGEASKQLPAPAEPEPSAPPRFAPQDHPRSALVSDTDALERLRSGATRPSEPGGGQDLPEDLLDEYEPLGDRGELEWDRDYTAGPGSEAAGRGTEYTWPPGDRFPEGGVEAGKPVVLDQGAVLDAFGNGWGRVLYAGTTLLGQRCLPPEHLRRTYRRYRVVRPLPVWQAATAPWFGQPGGGLRYRATHSIAELIALGHLLELTGELQAAEGQTVRIGRQRLAAADEGAGPAPADPQSTGESVIGEVLDPASQRQEATR